MRTILVLTYFTIKDDNAATFALKLAHKIKANILLCNIYPELDANIAVGNPVFITDMYGSMQQQSKNDLDELARRLNTQLDELNETWFKPTIRHCSKGGPLTVAINDVIASENIVMAVIAAHSKDDFFTFINVDHAREIIEEANCPVLVLPYQAKFQGFNKIAFACDLGHDNAQIVSSIGRLGKHFNSEIVITHVGNAPLGKTTEDYIIKRLVDTSLAPEERPKVTYQPVINKSINAGLAWLAGNTDIDLMVLVHRKRNLFQKIFERSVTKKMADHLCKPMLIFKGNYKNATVPAF